MNGKLARTKIVEFMKNCEIKNGRVASMVKGVIVSFDDKELGEIIGVPDEGYLQKAQMAKSRESPYLPCHYKEVW